MTLVPQLTDSSKKQSEKIEESCSFKIEWDWKGEGENN